MFNEAEPLVLVLSAAFYIDRSAFCPNRLLEVCTADNLTSLDEQDAESFG
jgi:hypothetical protein